MESTEPRRGLGTTVLVLLLALAFLVGTALFVYVGYQLLAPGNSPPTALVEEPTRTPLPSPSATATARPTATRAPTRTPLPAANPTAVSGTGDDSMPQTGLGPVASVGALMLASIAVGARMIRRRR